MLLAFWEAIIILLLFYRHQEAEKSIRFYQNISEANYDRKTLEVEIDRLKGIINDIHPESTENSFDWSELRTKIAQKALLIGIVLVALNQFSGVVAMLSYAANIFQDAGSSLSANVSTILIGGIQLLSNIVATNLVDRAGRKVYYICFSFNSRTIIDSLFLAVACDISHGNGIWFGCFGSLHDAQIMER